MPRGPSQSHQGDDIPAAVAKLASAWGFDITPQEAFEGYVGLKRLGIEEGWLPDQELSLEELETVAGGGFFHTLGAGLGSVGKGVRAAAGMAPLEPGLARAGPLGFHCALEGRDAGKGTPIAAVTEVGVETLELGCPFCPLLGRASAGRVTLDYSAIIGTGKGPKSKVCVTTL